MEDKKVSGSCLCGKVEFMYSGTVKVFQYCHCTRCQKFTGSAHASNIIIDPKSFQWTKGEEYVGRYELPEAKYFATCFCKNCGSSLPWLTKTGTALIVPAGGLNDDPVARPKHNIFYADKAPWYVAVDSLVKYDELPKK